MSRSITALLLLNALIVSLYTYFSFASYTAYRVTITPWQIIQFRNPIGEMQGLVVSTNYVFGLFLVSLAINIGYIIWLNKKVREH